MAQPKFTFPQMALLDWLFEADGRRFFVQHSHTSGSGGSHYFEVTGHDDEGRRTARRVYPSASMGQGAERDADFLRRLGGRENVDITTMFREKFFRSYNCNHTDPETWKAFSSGFAMKFAWYDRVYLPTDAARAWWAETGKARFEEMAGKRAAEAAAVDRWVVVGQTSRFSPRIPAPLAAKVPKGMALPLPSRVALRPQAICRVTKETDLRLYVTDVNALVRVDYGSQVVSGREPNMFVERKHVILDHADAETAQRLVDIDREHAEDVDRIAAQAVEEILPALLRLDDRLKQKDAEREDAMRELLEGRAGSPAPKR